MKRTDLKKTVDKVDGHKHGLLPKLKLSLHLHEPVDSNSSHRTGDLLALQITWSDGHSNLKEIALHNDCKF